MNLSAPIYRLKREARMISRDEKIPLAQALDRLAQREGFRAWSHLAMAHAAESPAKKLFSQTKPGDMILVGARPGQGKTLLCLELGVQAVRAGRQCAFFTLEYTEGQCEERLRALGVDPAELGDRFLCDTSDFICASYLIERMSSLEPGAVAVVDYLQLLDQRRETPTLQEQVRRIRTYTRERRQTFVFISQIDRRYDPAIKSVPDLSDIRLPNPLDLALFDETCFLNGDALQISKSKPSKIPT